jgi:hypothetical protein
MSARMRRASTAQKSTAPFTVLLRYLHHEYHEDNPYQYYRPYYRPYYYRRPGVSFYFGF